MGEESCVSYAQVSDYFFLSIVYHCDENHGIGLFLTWKILFFVCDFAEEWSTVS